MQLVEQLMSTVVAMGGQAHILVHFPHRHPSGIDLSRGRRMCLDAPPEACRFLNDRRSSWRCTFDLDLEILSQKPHWILDFGNRQ